MADYASFATTQRQAVAREDHPLHRLAELLTQRRALGLERAIGGDEQSLRFHLTASRDHFRQHLFQQRLVTTVDGEDTVFVRVDLS